MPNMELKRDARNAGFGLWSLPALARAPLNFTLATARKLQIAMRKFPIDEIYLHEASKLLEAKKSVVRSP